MSALGDAFAGIFGHDDGGDGPADVATRAFQRYF